MNKKTEKYVSSRFSDHYRNKTPSLPPQENKRELAYIKWDNQTMIRHIGPRDYKSLKMFLSESKPRHFYVSSALFKRPEANNMNSKIWEGSNLIFDIDAKDLPSVNKDDAYPKKMEKSKEEIKKLIEFIENDFGIENYSINFSGNQGYHLRVYDKRVIEMEAEERIEITNYVNLSKDINLEDQFISASSFGYPPTIKRFDPSGGWSRRLYWKVKDYFEKLQKMNMKERKDELQSYEGIGKTKSENINKSMDNIMKLIKIGAIDTSNGINKILEKQLEKIKEKQTNVDEPVTTDTNRLLRLQNSIHGKQGLLAKKIEKDEIEEFKPTKHAIPETFKNRKIIINIKEETEIQRNNTKKTFQKGKHKVPEYTGIALICQGKAEKIS